MTGIQATDDCNSEASAPHSFAGPIGLLGIGLMGSVVAQRLIDAGYLVCGWDVDPQRSRALEAGGARVADGILDVFQCCECILLSLPSHETVAEVLKSAENTMRGGQIIVDMSTGDPSAAELQAKSLAARNLEYLDATVSGSSAQLRDGQAVMLVGATNTAFAKCKPLFECLAPKIFHTGLPGSGAKMKLVTNLVLGLNRAALAEGLCFARKLGLDLEQSLHLLRESASYSRIMDTKGEKMLRRDFTPQARLSQHLKDVRLILAAAGQGARLPLTSVHQTLLEQAERMGLGQLDNSAIVEVIAAGNSSTTPF